MNQRLYLDWNATAPLRPEARAAMLAAMELVGNPSSVHAEGRAARALVERARAQVAEAVGCAPDMVVFTAGATDAASVLRSFPRVDVQPGAHDALWAHRRGEGDADVYAMGLANSETGLITEPPARTSQGWPVAGGHAARLLLDVTQAVGRIPFAFSWSDADFAVLSAHKLGGPKGAGALIVRAGVEIAPLSLGGGQELSRRAGTENLIGLAGFGAAAEAAQQDLAKGV
ncbi:MAG: aminotransferase class V-fold PLP-dependent enzyme, partial [Pararhodobacter sp.]